MIKENECMCCGDELTEVNTSPDKELCQECFEEMVLTEEDIEEIEALFNDEEEDDYRW